MWLWKCNQMFWGKYLDKNENWENWIYRNCNNIKKLGNSVLKKIYVYEGTLNLLEKCINFIKKSLFWI